MAKPSNIPTEKSLKTFSASLEDLTFNSKPIIDELTRFAGVYKQLAPQLVQSVEDHILEVRPEWKLPSLYLLDSILKNIKGDYLQLFSKNIVRIFCHCFEKLTEPDTRKALYKLRQTWSQYIQNRKLALIDKHVHALDPNWPVTAIENPPSPTIFVNPTFLKASDKSNGPTKPMKAGSQSPNHSTTTTVKKATPTKPVKRVTIELPSSKETSQAQNAVPKKENNKEMTIQQKRKKLLEEKKSERIKQQEALGISSERKTGTKRGGRFHSPPSSRGTSPLKLPSPRARSASPRSIAQKTRPQKSTTDNKQLKPPPEKRPKLEPASVSEPEPAPVSEPEPASVLSDTEPKEKEEEVVTSKEQPSQNNTDAAASSDEPRPIKGSHLELDDIPPELLPKHHELILKQIQAQLNSGNLSSEQHSTLCKQLDQLYELQKKKEETGRAKTSPSHKSEQTVKDSVPSDEFISLSGTNSDSPFFVDTHGSSSNDTFNFVGPNRGSRHDYRGRPPPHEYSRHPPPPPMGPYRGDPRPPFRGRRRPYPPNRQGRGRYFNEFEMGRRRGRMMPGPPPPHWQEPPQGGGYPGPPPAAPMDVSNLIHQLVDHGMIDNSQNESRGLGRSSPATVPTLGFTSATLKQKYSALIDLLHVGEQCGTCGVRFPSNSSDEYEKHLDWHYSQNKTEGQTTTSRGWFLHPEDWIKFDELSLEESQEKEAILKPTGESQEEEEVRAPSGEAVSSCLVLAGEENKVCVICQEPLEQFWEDEEDDWHYKDATRSQLTGKLYHTFCFQDAKEDELNVSNNSAQPASPEVKKELDS